LIDNNIKSPLSRKVLFGELIEGGRVNVRVADDKLEFDIATLPKPLTKEERRALKTAAKSVEIIDENTTN